MNSLLAIVVMFPELRSYIFACEKYNEQEKAFDVIMNFEAIDSEVFQ